MIFTASNFGSTWAQSSETFLNEWCDFSGLALNILLDAQGVWLLARTERLGEEQSSLRDLNFSPLECGGKNAGPAGLVVDWPPGSCLTSGASSLLF